MQYGDLPEFCDFGYLARVARVNAATLWSLAQAPSTPRGVVIDTTQLTNATTLRWQPGTEPDLGRLRGALARDDGSGVDARAAGRQGRHGHVDLSKDNVFFGVRAVDSDGHRSPVAAPQPSS